MKKAVDIDALLGEGKLDMVLGGKAYEIEDVDLSVFMTSGKDEKDEQILHKQLAAILKVDKKELKGVGIRAASLALKAIRDWVTDSSDEMVEAETPQKNP